MADLYLRRQEPRTLSHQGRALRLSLPATDLRPTCEDGSERKRAPPDLEEDLDRFFEARLHTQTVDIFPDACGDGEDVRVVCSVSDRVEWERKVRQVRERRLRELGVGHVTNVRSGVPPVVVGKPIAGDGPLDTVSWTGLHSPAVSTDSIAGVGLGGRKRRLSSLSVLSDRVRAAAPPTPSALCESIEALRHRHHELTRSISELVERRVPPRAEHGRALSQREIVHHRLNSIVPVRVRSRSSRNVSGIQPIPEESECQAVPRDGSESAAPDWRPVATDARSLHQHLASHDMSELIKTNSVPKQCLQGDLYMPDFEYKYTSFDWADEPMEAAYGTVELASGGMPGLTHLASSHSLSTQIPLFLQTPYVPSLRDQSSDGLGRYWLPGSLDTGLDLDRHAHLEVAPQPAEPHVQSHQVTHSNLNLGAPEFVPFALDIVKPNPGSQAIPIVRPSEVRDEEDRVPQEVVDGAQVQESPQEDSLPFDAYEGFDSCSEDSSTEEEISIGGHAIEVVQVSDANDDRVKSFKFPSPTKSAPATPLRSRTTLFESPSPDGGPTRSVRSLPLLATTSTPRKTPRIFKKSVALEDTELDSIIMDLSVRDLPTCSSPEDDGTSYAEQSFTDNDTTDQVGDETPAVSSVRTRPSLRRVSSAKLLLSHKDADVGLLLDAMLSAKFAGVSDSLSGLQSSVTAIEQHIQSTKEKEFDQGQYATIVDALQQDFPVLRADNDLVADLRVQLDERQRYLESVITAEAALKTEVENLRAELDTQSLAGSHEASPKDLAVENETVSRLEGQLLESTTFCSALQSQYSAAELSLTKLRKELSDTVCARDQALRRVEDVFDKYNRLQQHLEDSACEVADEQARWRETVAERDARIALLEHRVEDQGCMLNGDGRRHSSVSATTTGNDNQMMQYLMDRVKALELSNQHLQKSHQAELQARDQRLDTLMEDWKQMTKQVAAADMTIDGLRAEIVMNAEVEDRLVDELDRYQGVVDTLTSQLRKSGPVSILKRSQSESDTREDNLADQAILRLTTQLNAKDTRIAQLEELLTKPADSTERQILSAVSENIARQHPDEQLQLQPAAGALKANISELRRMRLSWEVKHAPTLQLTPRPSVVTGAAL